MMKYTGAQKGFSLPELIIGIFIMVLIGTAAATFQNKLFSNNFFIQETLNAEQDIRSALKRMNGEIREAGYANTGAYPLSVATATQLSIYTDINNDNVYERVRYFVDGTMLRRGSITPTGSPLSYNPANEIFTTIVRNLSTASVFSYYNKLYTGSGAPLSGAYSLSDIRMVRVKVSVDKDSTKPPGPLTDETKIFIRSLKDNS